MYNFAMVFGKIEYLNLLPFHIFMKRFTKSTQQSMSMHYKRGVPAEINKKFLARSVDAAFISSISAQKHTNVGLGIIAKKEVKSVLVIPSKDSKRDRESASSNVLAKILDVSGEVLIGDKALKYALQERENIDLAKLWNERTGLPFVFALLCYHNDKKIYKEIQREFLKAKVKIPQYILKLSSQRTGIKERDILEYLELISYSLDAKAKLGLKRFYREAKRV